MTAPDYYDETVPPLVAVAFAAEEREKWGEALSHAIREAVKTESMRTVAKAAGVSHEQVRRIVASFAD